MKERCWQLQISNIHARMDRPRSTMKSDFKPNPKGARLSSGIGALVVLRLKSLGRLVSTFTPWDTTIQDGLQLDQPRALDRNWTTHIGSWLESTKGENGTC